MLRKSFFQDEAFSSPNPPKISVIIPVYNAAPYLRKCLDSILNQTLREIEILCVNDGSKDDSLLILEAIQKKDKRVRIFSQKNQGVSIARNVGIDNSRGDFISFVDADDWLPDDTVYKDLYDTAVNKNVLICGGSVARYKDDGSFIPYPANEKSIFLRDQLLSFRSYQYDFGFTRYIIARNFIEKERLRFMNLICYEDPVFLARALHKAGCFYALKRVTYCSRRGHHSYDLQFKHVEDLLTGIIENIKLAKENGYDTLLDLQKERLRKNYIRRGMGKCLGEDSNGKLKEMFDEINLLLNNKTRIEYEAFLYYSVLQEKKIAKLKDKVKTQELSIKMERTKQIKEKENIQNQLDCMKNSVSFKIGRMITFMPRKIRDCFKK